jgi:hypothetical protein
LGFNHVLPPDLQGCRLAAGDGAALWAVLPWMAISLQV